MTFRAAEVYEVLEPLLKDYRKLRYRDQSKHTQLATVQRIIQTQFSWLLSDLYRRICRPTIK